MTILKIYVAMVLVSWPLISGMVYSDMMYEFYTTTTPRKQAGFAICWGFAASIIWPVFLPATFLMTGFAERGIWNSHHIDHEKYENESI